MQDQLSTSTSTLAQVQAQFAPNATPFLYGPFTNLSQRCLERALELREKLPRTLPQRPRAPAPKLL